MKRWLCAWVVGLAACGGGGGGGVVVVPAPNPREDAAQQVLAGCSRDTFGEFVTVVRAFHDAVLLQNPTGIAYVEVITGDRVSMDWDLDGAPGVDYVATLRFIDSMDQTVVPFDLQTLVTGTPLVNALTNVGPALRLVVTFVTAGTGNVNGQFISTIDAGVANQVRGNVSVTFAAAGCSGTFSMRLVPVSNLNAPFPGATVDFSMSRNSDLVVGVSVMDQTSATRVEVRLNGTSEAFNFLVNLVSGAVVAE